MYPLIRLTKTIITARSLPPAGLWDTHVSQHVVWPTDIDMFMELNNGRTLTLFDLGRFALATRIGLMATLRRERWGLAVAGASVRWRRRVLPFERIEMRTRAIALEGRFAYLEQSLWKRNGECACHGLLRTAVTDRNGAVDAERIIQAMGVTGPMPTLPDWVRAWADAEALRPWPPMQD